MRYSAAQVLCGTLGSKNGECRVRHLRGSGPENIPEPLSDWPDIRGLSSLQAGRETWLNGDAIETALKAYYEGLPKITRDRIHIAGTSIQGIFGPGSREFNNILAGAYDRFFRPFRRTEYTLWPCNYNGNHWVLAVIRKGKADENSNRWDQVLQVAVVDSWRAEGAVARNQMITFRLRRILERIGFTVAAQCERPVWTNWQRDEWSCGLRTFWAAKQFINRIKELADNPHEDFIWESLCWWFNPDQVRWEMIGLNAYEAVKAMGYRARVAVELTQNVLDDSGALQNAGDVMRPPEGEVEVLEMPPRIFPRRRVPIPVPNERRVAPWQQIPEGDALVDRRNGVDNSTWSDQTPIRSAPKRRLSTSPERTTEDDRFEPKRKTL
ncbi:hypothetical protein F4805DRAFT_444440 [Annulohypoxylon moriforme]|nr:hypothetical protein F4805DRAFT_444440 [Annulohypoxylon moriforme]